MFCWTKRWNIIKRSGISWCTHGCTFVRSGKYVKVLWNTNLILKLPYSQVFSIYPQSCTEEFVNLFHSMFPTEGSKVRKVSPWCGWCCMRYSRCRWKKNMNIMYILKEFELDWWFGYHNVFLHYIYSIDNLVWRGENLLFLIMSSFKKHNNTQFASIK